MAAVDREQKTENRKPKTENKRPSQQQQLISTEITDCSFSWTIWKILLGNLSTGIVYEDEGDTKERALIDAWQE